MPARSDIHILLESLTGSWKGETKTWFEPNILADQSPMTAKAKMVLESSFLVLEYAGKIDSKPFEGVYTCGYDIPNQIFQVSWIDSFHMGTGMMLLTGAATNNSFNVKGTYTSPHMPEPWGWRIRFELTENDELHIISYNISPEGQEDLATETIFKRS